MSVRRRFPRVRFALALALGATVVGLGLRWQADLPDPEALERWAPAQGTLLTDRFGVPIGEFYDERRYVLPAADIPDLVGNAFIAAEDARFRDHFGIDLAAVARATFANVSAGRLAQGGSTITQQVVRTLLLDDRVKTWSRKAREAALASRSSAATTRTPSSRST